MRAYTNSKESGKIGLGVLDDKQAGICFLVMVISVIIQGMMTFAEPSSLDTVISYDFSSQERMSGWLNAAKTEISHGNGCTEIKAIESYDSKVFRKIKLEKGSYRIQVHAGGSVAVYLQKD